MQTSINFRKICGFTLVELLITLALLSIVALSAMPLAEISSTRAKEQELKRALRHIRVALDQYKSAADLGVIPKGLGESGYPPSLDMLTQPLGGAEKGNGTTQLPLILLRDLPRDPFNDDPSLEASQTWSTRSYLSPPEDPQPGADVFDVHTKSPRVGLNGIAYQKW